MTSAWAPVLAQACPTTSTPIHVAAGHLICASRLARATCPVNTCTSGTCQVAPTEAAIIRHFGPSPRRRSSERCHVDRAVTSKRLLLGSFQRPSFGSRQLRELSRLPSDGKATDLSGSDGRRSQAGRNGGRERVSVQGDACVASGRYVGRLQTQTRLIQVTRWLAHIKSSSAV